MILCSICSSIRHQIRTKHNYGLCGFGKLGHIELDTVLLPFCEFGRITFATIVRRPDW